MGRAALEEHIRATPVEGSPDEMRAAFRRLAHWPDAPELPPVEEVGGVPGRWVGQGADRTVWLHGGGYVFGGSDTHAACAARLARSLGSRVFVPDLPLAPEAPWRDILSDAGAVVEALDRPDLVGDSAGGHLALALAQEGAPVRRLAVLSPNSHHTDESRTRKRNSDSDLMNDHAQDRALAKMALPAPLQGWPGTLHTRRFAGLGPLFVSASLSEVLLDDALILAREAALDGVQVTLRTWPRLMHMWHLWPDATPEAREVLDAVAAFLASP